MKESQKVSIIIPCYNAEKFIVETVESALNQSYENCEVIVINDGSTDETAKNLESYLDRIIYKRIENGGAPNARNVALELSSGRYIQYLDADDLLEKDKIKKQMRVMEGRDDVLVTSPCATFEKQISADISVDRGPVCESDNPIEWLAERFLKSVWKDTFVHCYLIPKKLIEAAGNWDPQISYNADGEFFARVHGVASQIKYVSETEVYYRVGVSGSVSSYRRESDAIDALKSMEVHHQVFANTGRLTKKYREALKKGYKDFLFIFSPQYPHLLKIAVKRVKKLGFFRLGGYGKAKFKMISHLVGFRLALKIRNYSWGKR